MSFAGMANKKKLEQKRILEFCVQSVRCLNIRNCAAAVESVNLGQEADFLVIIVCARAFYDRRQLPISQ